MPGAVAIAALVSVFGRVVGAGLARWSGGYFAAAPREVATICPIFRVAAKFSSGYRARRRRSKSAPGGNVSDVSKATATVSNRLASRCPCICRRNERMATNICRGRTLSNKVPLLGISSLDWGRYPRPFLSAASRNRAGSRRTCGARDQPAPVADGMPRPFNSAAMARSDVVPAARSSATIGASSYPIIRYMVTPSPLGHTTCLTGITNLVVEGTMMRPHAAGRVAKKEPVQTTPSQTPAPILAKTK
jgi:hypothetical protein